MAKLNILVHPLVLFLCLLCIYGVNITSGGVIKCLPKKKPYIHNSFCCFLRQEKNKKHSFGCILTNAIVKSVFFMLGGENTDKKKSTKQFIGSWT